MTAAGDQLQAILLNILEATEGRQELNHIDGLIVMDGGVRIVASGYNLGAVGVSGAPGGDKDAACAKKALEKLTERIEFAIE